MLAGAGALSGWGGPRPTDLEGVKCVEIGHRQHPRATVLNRSPMPRSVLPRASGRLFDTLKLWAWQ